jgi:S-adenosyl-L-methionine hydrolase (adenosine-forming)
MDSVMNPSKSPITLMTDFGADDIFVGVMKGVIHSIHPGAQIIDLTHAIPSFDIVQAAFKIRQAADYFPVGTVHVIVVDPGVGSERRAIAMKSGGHYFVAPDNGVLTFIAKRGIEECATIANPDYCLPEVSASFHGRDIFAPVGAHLLRGVRLSKLGPPLSALQELQIAAPTVNDNGTIRGEVLWADHFGNLITNIVASQLPQDAHLFVEGVDIGRLARTYADVAEGEALAMIGSFGHLEVAVRMGNAAEELRADRGTEVIARTPLA